MKRKQQILLTALLICIALLSSGCGQKQVANNTGSDNTNSESHSTTKEDTEPSTDTPTETPVTEESSSNDIILSNTYCTKFGEVNAITYPQFIFDYPNNWTVTQEEVTQTGENVTLANERGAEIKFTHIGGVAEGTLDSGGSTTDMSRVEVSSIADASFTPNYVQATDYSSLGKFVVAKLKTTGYLDMISGSDFTDVDGATSYAVLPESRLGTDDAVRQVFETEFAFWYSDYISLIANAPDGQFTEQEELEVQQILTSFRTE
ncbi:MAG: hypothetical protein PHS82_13040 [Lachnospiraceae bacterium]|nr:hypothetical protein [Lachnospiraceae bacterium]